jgi:crotonobetainyl-CoA:carnitine CoA-transferase CaiB-like acyl-CoA transferase
LLSGLRVIDLSMGWAGPLAARHLADRGADVIKVESCRHFDWWRGWDLTPEAFELRAWEKSPAFNMVNRNKRGITLDLSSDRGAEILKRLVKDADAVVENYAGTVLPKLGLEYDVLRQVNPSIVMLSMPPFGATGDWKTYRAYGSTIEQASGLPHFQGEEGGPPAMQHVALGDPVAGLNGAAALLTTLLHREISGEGQHIDLSHVECVIPLGVHGFLEHTVLGRSFERPGRRHPHRAPHGVYPCQGHNRWMTIAIETDEQWRTLAGYMGEGLKPQVWAQEERFSTAAQRKADEDELDRLLSLWTADRDRDLLSSKLRRLGLPCVPFYDSGDLLGDPQLNARGFWQWVERDHVGVQPQPSPPYRSAREALPIVRPAPTLGQHNQEVLGDLLGMDEGEIEELTKTGVIGTFPIRA